MKHFDAVIIGTGQAGKPLAVALAKEGWKVAVIEHDHLGGSCVNYGCTPTKALVASARRAFVARNSREHGIGAESVAIDFKAIMERKERIVQRFRSGVEKSLARENITLFRGTGAFEDEHSVRVGEEVVRGENIFINTGHVPVIPDIPGLAGAPYLTSTTLLELKKLPAHLLIIGGGYIGLEFAQMFRRFGSSVTIVDHNAALAAREDEDISKEMQKILESEGIEIVLESEVNLVEHEANRIDLSLAQKGKARTLSGTHLLVATGRKPATEKLNLEKASIEHEKGMIKVNDRLETNVPHVWALGDVKGGPAFTHVSYNDYEIVYRNLIQGEHASVHDRVLVYAMFIDPSLGRAGLSEREAKEQGLDYAAAEYPMSSVARAIEMGETAGKMKLIVDRKSKKILGAAVLGYEGAELIHYVAGYMNAGAPYTTLQRAITIHPTLAEGIQSLALELD